MRKILFLLCIFCLMSSPAWGQVSLQANAGGSFSTAPSYFSDFYGTGYHLGGGVRFAFAPSLEVSASVQYNDFLVDEEAVYDEAGVPDDLRDDIELTAGASVFSGGVHVRYNVPLGGAITPYFKVGPSVYRISEEEVTVSGGGLSIDVTDGSTETAIGFDVGVGVAYEIAAGTSVFVEPAYAIAFSDAFDDEGPAQYAPIQVGLSFSP